MAKNELFSISINNIIANAELEGFKVDEDDKQRLELLSLTTTSKEKNV
jgi:hypothetical protein